MLNNEYTHIKPVISSTCAASVAFVSPFSTPPLPLYPPSHLSSSFSSFCSFVSSSFLSLSPLPHSPPPLPRPQQWNQSAYDSFVSPSIASVSYQMCTDTGNSPSPHYASFGILRAAPPTQTPQTCPSAAQCD